MKRILKVKITVLVFLMIILYGNSQLNVIPHFPESTYCEQSSKQTLWKLRDDLLNDYDHHTRSKLNYKDVTNVSVKLMLKSFSYDVDSHLLTINAWTTVTWIDDLLKWDPDDYKGIGSTNIETNAIWTPDLSHYNRYQQDGSHHIINDVDCHLMHTGRIYCLSPGKYETLCTADLTKYPYDTQKCALIIGSWVHTGEEVDIRNMFGFESYVHELTPNPEWDLIQTEFYHSNGADPAFPNSTFPSISYVFTIERRSGFLEATAIVPSLGLVTMTLTILLLDVIDPDRIVLIVCDIVTHTIYLHYLRWNIPSFGNNIPKIILFGRDSMVIVFVELALSIILRALRINHGSVSNLTIGMIRKILDSRVGNMVLFMDFSIKSIKLNKNGDDGENVIENVQPNNEKDCVLFVKLVDRLSFVIFLMAYFIMMVKFVF